MTDHAAEHLAHAIRDLADAVRHVKVQTGITSILQRLDTMENHIMSKIAEFAAAQQAFNEQQNAAIDSISTSVTGITGDIAELNKKIAELQNSSGAISPEDQALLDGLQTQGAALSSKLGALKDALAQLDSLTPPAPPAPVAEAAPSQVEIPPTTTA